MLLCLAMPFAGTFTFLKVEKHNARKDAKELLLKQLDKSALTVFHFQNGVLPPALEWEKPDEFKLNGEFYDVVRTETIGDTIVYWCWHDEKESEVERELERLLSLQSGHLPVDRDKGDYLVSVLKGWNLVNTGIYPAEAVEFSQTDFEEIAGAHPLPGTPPPSPPPRTF